MIRFVLFLTLSILATPSVFAEKPDFDASRLEATELATGLNRPMEIAVSSDGRVFFIELEGSLNVYLPDQEVVHTIGKLSVTTEQENGLIGLALDPDFAENNHVFLQYSPPDYPGQHVSRFTLRDGKLDLSTEKVLLKFTEQRKECCHHAGSLQFGPDGCLFIGTGDNTHPGGDSHGYAPIDERPDRAPYDAQKSASNTHHLGGKVLRIRPKPDGTYEIPKGNLFPPDGSKGLPEIYVMGCRNPWRINVDQKSGFLYWGEVGPDARGNNDRGPRGYDEINQARVAGNFGWPYFIGNNEAYADVDFETGKIGPRYNVDQPINESPNNTGSRELPPAQAAFIYYPYDSSNKFPELGQGGRTACAGPVYHYETSLKSTTKFPNHFDNTLFIFEWSRHWIKAVHLNDDGSIRKIEPFMPDRKILRPIDIEFGPYGAMYVIEYGESWGVNKEARIVRIDYVWGNRQPIAIAKATNNVGKEPLEVAFSSAGSYDKDQEDKITYEWVRVESDGKTSARKSLSTEANPTIRFSEPGVFNVELTMRDGNGGVGTASVPVLVGNAKPVVEIRKPVGGFFKPGEPIRFHIFVNDLEDGTNDFDLADDQDLTEIDSASPTRVSMYARKIAGKFGKDLEVENAPLGMQLMKQSDCFNCHDVRQKRVGPPLIEISKKYRDNAHAISESVKRVIAGSSNVWGKIPMIPHKQHTPEQVHTMVDWIYSLREEGGLQVIGGFVGDVPTSDDYSGGLLLEAVYTDLGAGNVPPITETVSLPIRSRHIEAEHANRIQGSQVFGSETADNKKFVGGINHGHHLRIDDLTTESVDTVTLRFSSAGAGGNIEFHQDRADGPLLASANVTPEGDWENWREQTVEFLSVDGVHDVFVVFTNEERKGGLMNLDSMFFHPTE